MCPQYNKKSHFDKLEQIITDKLAEQDAKELRVFAHKYYHHIPDEDLENIPHYDLYSMILSTWKFIYQRKKTECNVRVYNPTLEEHGWYSKYTVVEINMKELRFVLDSVRMLLNKLDLTIHYVVNVNSLNFHRNKHHKVTTISDEENDNSEIILHLQIDKQQTTEHLQTITDEIKHILATIERVVSDWYAMRQQALETKEILAEQSDYFDKNTLQENLDFISWITTNHFTFLGYCEYDINTLGENIEAKLNQESCLGLCKKIFPKNLSTQEISLFLEKDYLLDLGKEDSLSPLHRPAFLDFIAIKVLDQNGHPIKQKRFVGLYTSVAYSSRPKRVPLIRKKVENALKSSDFRKGTYEYRCLLNIIENLPRDDLFQASVAELKDLAVGVFHLQERQRIRIFIRKDKHQRFFSCLVFVPRERFNSSLRYKLQLILLQELQGIEVSFSTNLSESILARIHFLVRLPEPQEHPINFDVQDIEKKLVAAAKNWNDYLHFILTDHIGEDQGHILFKKYQYAFPESYKENFTAQVAVTDIKQIETTLATEEVGMCLYQEIEEQGDFFGFKLYRLDKSIPLSDIIPLLENMGLIIIRERPYTVKISDSKDVWINDYKMKYTKTHAGGIDQVSQIFQDAFKAIWHQRAENDKFNRLILSACLNWRQIILLRSYAKYLWQIGITYSVHYIAELLDDNVWFAKQLVDFFENKFDPEKKFCEKDLSSYVDKIEQNLEQVDNLNADRVIRTYLDLIKATVRTNYYQTDAHGEYKEYLSFKIDSHQAPEMPLPKPLYEIFVYAAYMEGIHLRAGKVARGGIRWSDRKEDFRTEVLGLMKAQQVKNCVIVPKGAKGGFVVKSLQHNLSPDQKRQQAIHSYKTFIRGLLDITDNRIKQEIVKPTRVVCYDEEDPYLVVAADKGTATFSDIANTISAEYHFWLGDAFASGGSDGYDHKKMGITAKGAWESVKRHFQELGKDIQTEEFTVIGIGDMAGDVFGNGMLLSEKIKLIAAFNHMHIFIDPTPDPQISFTERQRLFLQERSTWDDYNSELISKGGGVFRRDSKSITLSEEIKKVFHITEKRLSPTQLIKKILTTPTDLLWNGGIGTFVKNNQESDIAVSDRANDAIRITAQDLNCQVVGEGGNLGFTQLARIAYSKLGGKINTDAIDNSGGVNCSDKEVNIKILLNDMVKEGDMTLKQRNHLLMEMTEDVTDLVLANNRKQTEAISIALSQAEQDLEIHARVLEILEATAGLDRAIEFLPDQEEINKRLLSKQGLTRPELAVLMAYVKNLLKDQLYDSDFPENEYILESIKEYFPQHIQDRYGSAILQHRLKREILCTEVSNAIINEMGISFTHRLQDETGALPQDIVKAYLITRQIFQYDLIKEQILSLGSQTAEDVKIHIILEFNRLLRRATRWFLRNQSTNLDIEHLIQSFQDPIIKIKNNLHRLITNSQSDHDWIPKEAEKLIRQHIPRDLAYQVAGMSAMYSSLDIVDAAVKYRFDVLEVAEIYFRIGDHLDLRWFRYRIKKQPVKNHWDALARASFRDEIDCQQRKLTVVVLQLSINRHSVCASKKITEWVTRNPVILARWEKLIIEMKALRVLEFTVFAVALRELSEVSKISLNNIQ